MLAWFISVLHRSCHRVIPPVPSTANPLISSLATPGTLVFAHPSSSGRSMCSGIFLAHLCFTHTYTLLFTYIGAKTCLSCRMEVLSGLQIPTNWRIFSNPGLAVTRFCWSHRWALPRCRQLQKTRTAELLATKVTQKATSAGWGQMCESCSAVHGWKWESRQGNLQPPPQLSEPALTILVLAARPHGTRLAPHTAASSLSEERHMQRSFSPF